MRVIPFFVIAAFLLGGCDFNLNNPSSGTKYSPVLMMEKDLANSVIVQTARPIQQPGKIYYKLPMIFVVDKYNGVHLIDNHDPKNPVKLAFIRIPGVMDVAVRGNTLYADNAVDLVAINISDLNNITVTSRVKGVFPDLIPPDADFVPSEFQAGNRTPGTVIVGWEKIN